MFVDIGCDTVFLTYPNLFLKSKINGGYTLNYGFGGYLPGKWFDMLQPFNWIQIFVHDIVTANIVSLFLEYVVTAFFAFLFFKLLFKTDTVSIICSLIWTYSGYMVLWGQHGFSVGITYFTLVMYFLQCLIRGYKKGIFIIVPFSILAMSYYYFFYMSGLFAALYILGYCIINKHTIKKCVSLLAKLLCIGIISAGIGAVGLVPSLRTFLVSARTQVQEQKAGMIFHDVQYIFSAIGRCISNDIFDTGNNYTGYYNYYEAPMLACSALFVPCALILIRNRKYYKQVMILFFISIFALACPMVSYILNLDSRKPRWTYMLILLMVICIGYSLDCLMKNIIKIKICDFLITIVVYTICFTILLYGDRCGIADVKRTPFIITFLCCVCYIVLLYIALNKSNRNIAHGVLLTIVVLEMVLNNYASVNDRDIVTREMLKNELYNDGTDILLDYISDDNSIYRINKTYISVFYNDGMVQGYNGLSIYNPTNSNNLINYYQSLGYPLINGKIHCVNIGTESNMLNTLLGVKYIITTVGDKLSGDYKLIYSYNDKNLYYNKDALGFGYIYNNRISKQQYDTLSNEDKIKAFSEYYYITDDNSNYMLADIDNIDTNIGLTKLKKSSVYDTVMEKNKITLYIDNPYTDDAMLCAPVIYDTDWHAYVNGVEQNITNINGGLIGINLSDYGIGTYRIELKYYAKEYLYGGVISVISTMIFIVILFFVFKRNNYDTKMNYFIIHTFGGE